MLINSLCSQFVSFVFVSLLMSGTPCLLLGGEVIYTKQMETKNLEVCRSLVSCSGYQNCTDLPLCNGQYKGFFEWEQCQRGVCWQGDGKIICDYKCTERPLSFHESISRAHNIIYENINIVAPSLYAIHGVSLGLLGAIVQKKPISIKRLCGYACLGGLASLNVILNPSNVVENLAVSVGAIFAVTVLSEYVFCR